MQTKTDALKHNLFVGIAIFSMVFGAGNIIFPLLVGNLTGSNCFIAFVGIFLSSVLIPLLGFLACLNFGGRYQAFLEHWIGSVPAFLTALLAMLILGPLCCIPRCAVLAHAALSWNFWPNLPFFWFSAIFFSIIFALGLQKDRLINVFGKFLGPINLFFMGIFILKGFVTPGIFNTGQTTMTQAFSLGFFEAYKTYDLLAMIFYAFSIVTAITAYVKANKLPESADYILGLSRKGAVIAASIFSSIYLSFCIVAAKHATNIPITVKADLINAYSTSLLGNHLGLLAGLIVLLACFNSACALTVVFSGFMSDLTQRFGIGYANNVLFCSIISFGFASFGFNGIESAMTPATQIIYPALIIISLLGTLNFALKTVKT
jgi:LIVCS family branched-chain amino acid:cation transporter